MCFCTANRDKTQKIFNMLKPEHTQVHRGSLKIKPANTVNINCQICVYLLFTYHNHLFHFSDALSEYGPQLVAHSRQQEAKKRDSQQSIHDAEYPASFRMGGNVPKSCNDWALFYYFCFKFLLIKGQRWRPWRCIVDINVTINNVIAILMSGVLHDPKSLFTQSLGKYWHIFWPWLWILSEYWLFPLLFLFYSIHFTEIKGRT